MAVRTKQTTDQDTTATSISNAPDQSKQSIIPSSFLVFGLFASLVMLGSNYIGEQNQVKAEAQTCAAKLESTYTAIDKLRGFAAR